MILHLPLFERIVAEVHSGRAVALCAVVGTRGSTPQFPGSLMLVDQNGQTTGTVGGGYGEADVCRQACALLETQTPRLLSLKLDCESGEESEAVCGGAMDVAVVPITNADTARQFDEALTKLRGGHDATITLRVGKGGQLVEYRLNIECEPTLLIAGAGHVGAELARLCVRLEFRVVVVDDRAEFANAELLPPPIEPLAADITKTLGEYPIDPATYVVIVTRGHQYDEWALAAVVNSNARYIGMMGSRRKVETIRKNLLEAGVDPVRLDRVHAPIGLPIHAMTVPEIAVSIAAQLIQVRREHKTKEVVVGPTPVAVEAR
ncbi:MAG: XdhC family protein [Phycisphaerae bacterium]|nr:XdhC family protein [Phycisphaerae bacterium]